MSEQIIQLIKQAGLEFDDDFALEPEPIYYITQTELLKFAELIVKECINVVENVPYGYSDYRNQIEDSFRLYCIEDLRQHFEVK